MLRCNVTGNCVGGDLLLPSSIQDWWRNVVLYDYGDNIGVSVEELNAVYSYHTVWLRLLQHAPNIAMKYVSTPGLRFRSIVRSSFGVLWHSLTNLDLQSTYMDLRIAKLYTDAIRIIITLDPASMREYTVARESITHNCRRFIGMIDSIES